MVFTMVFLNPGRCLTRVGAVSTRTYKSSQERGHPALPPFPHLTWRITLRRCGLLPVSRPGRQTLVSPFYRRDVLQRPQGHLLQSHQVAESTGLIGNPFHTRRHFEA